MLEEQKAEFIALFDEFEAYETPESKLGSTELFEVVDQIIQENIKKEISENKKKTIHFYCTYQYERIVFFFNL